MVQLLAIYHKSFNQGAVKNNYDPQRRLARSEKITSDPLGCLVQRGAFELECNRDLSNWTYNGQATTGQSEGVGCRLGLKYALNVAAVVSEVEII